MTNNTATTYVIAVIKVERQLDERPVTAPALLDGLTARLGEFYATSVAGVDEVLVPQIVTLDAVGAEAYRMFAAAVEVGADGDMLDAYADTAEGIAEATRLTRALVTDAALERA